jgi:hypothetical protein
MGEPSRTLVWWPALVAMALAAVMVAGGLVDFVVFSLFMLAPAALLALAAGVPALALGLANIMHRRFMRGASYLVLPCAIAAACIAPLWVVGTFNHAGQILAFELKRGAYEAAIAKSTLPDGKRFAVFDWDGFGGINTFLVFDESDALARREVPENGRSWAECAGQSTRFVGHYYLCSD